MSLLIFLFTLFFHLVFGEQFYSKTSGVVTLDHTNFFETLKKNKNEVSMVEFFAPWCGHCQQLKPEYIKLAKELSNVAKVYAIDANDQKNSPIAQQFGIQGFPTLKVFIGDKPQDYQGQRTAEAMKDFILKLLPHDTTLVTESNLEKFLTKYINMPRALVLSKKPTVSPTVKKLSMIFQDHIKFGVVTKDAKNVAKKYDVSVAENTILFIFPVNQTENPIMFTGNTKAFREIETWLASFAPGFQLEDTSQFPKLLDESCFQQHCVKKGLCVILIRGEDETEANNAHATLYTVYETLDDASLFAFSQIENVKERDFVTKLFGDLPTMYSNLIVFAPTKKRFAHYVGSFNDESIKGFISNILTGKTPTAPIRTNEIPKLSTETQYCKVKEKESRIPNKDNQKKESPSAKHKQDEVVETNDEWKFATPGHGSSYILELTQNNFASLILDSNQAAIVEFYAPWCGHCKQFAPEFARAASLLKGMVLFGGVNCDEAKSLCEQFGVRGYPTIKIFGTGSQYKKKTPPKTYNGARTFKDMEKEAINILYNIKIPLLSNSQDYKTFLDDETSQKMLLFSEKNKPPTLLRALASKYANVSFAMISSNQKQLIEETQLKVPSYPKIYAIVGNKDGQFIEYNNENSFEKLCSFIDQTFKTQQKTEL